MLCHQFLSWHMHTVGGQDVANIYGSIYQLDTHHRLLARQHRRQAATSVHHKATLRPPWGPALSRAGYTTRTTQNNMRPPDLKQTTPTNPQQYDPPTTWNMAAAIALASLWLRSARPQDRLKAVTHLVGCLCIQQAQQLLHGLLVEQLLHHL